MPAASGDGGHSGPDPKRPGSDPHLAAPAQVAPGTGGTPLGNQGSGAITASIAPASPRAAAPEEAPAASAATTPSHPPAAATADDDVAHTESAYSTSSSAAASRRHSAAGSSGMSRITTNASMGPDAVAEAEPYSSFVEVPDSVYDRFTPGRKLVVVAVLSFCSFLAPISSTAVLSAVPEVAAEFGTTGTVINISNAFYMFFMGVSPMFWGPLSQVYGRRIVNLVTAVLFTACSIGTVFATSLEAFIVFRLLTAFEGTSFILVGSAVIGDLYRPTERATALSWFLSGTLIGPALGPFLAGIIVTYQSWRVIFWMQTGLGALALVGVVFLLPETAHRLKKDDLVGMPRRRKARVLCSMISPLRVVKLFAYPNLTLTGLASAGLLFNMYSLLTPIRYVINPRFNLTTPMQSGFFYLAPGCGYLVGSLFGGQYADYTVKRWMAKRGGRRVPEDRLRSAVVFIGVVVPACTLTYGWGLERDVGGVPLAVVTLFVQAVAQLFGFPSLNTYCLDVMQPRAAEVVAGNYMIRYMFACLGTAVVLPAVGAVGVGWFCTISSAFLVLSTLGLCATIRWGEGWRDARDQRRRARRAERRRRAREVEGGEAGGEAKGARG
ncbi:hypothetical protein GGTG_06135 [Gaeumannomyces tritici R3-111a-1]|uniref:Major facilitator superfamily (MFS) profile domain-containing protein n=1 Tax=Gaeumannomyces tritici (strain R3-111a-1) TaxID=644352 RepID=J3NXY0_GAET3|nr:hypothetical protein GGTG_06135 [Gaeumannomyces tritici R3-111a-1]EJT76213.1 hypothetical protein GGTG_06135 [Gaeumannomyces tritici R3-111a-1]